MKTLYVMRHAQKIESNSDEYDYDIELSEKGKIDSQNVANKFKNLGNKIDLIVSSPAIRARQTAEIVSDILDYKKNIMYNEVIYQAFLNEIIESLTYTFDTVDNLLLIGHNPALTALLITFTEYKEELNTSEIVKIEFNCNSWTSINKTNAKYIISIKPS
ncbi:MAG: phosphoglycerate mutase [Arcobacter sp.]|nr:phosphoglycerate mutase [Arcobacter sp.]